MCYSYRRRRYLLVLESGWSKEVRYETGLDILRTRAGYIEN